MINFHVRPPQPDESLSSVLDRACGMFNLSRLAMVRQLGRLGRCDFDAPPPGVCEMLGDATRVPVEVLQALSVSAARGVTLVQGTDRDAYCPLCVADDVAAGNVPYFRLDWARLWMTHCRRHGTPLMPWRDMSPTGQRMIAHTFYVSGMPLPRWFEVDRQTAASWRKRCVADEAFALWRAICNTQLAWDQAGVGDPLRLPEPDTARREGQVGRLAMGLMARRRADRACMGALLAVNAEQAPILTYRYRRPYSRFTVPSIRHVRVMLTDLQARHLVTALIGWAFGSLDVPLAFATGEPLPPANTSAWMDLALGFQNLPAYRHALEDARRG